MFISWWIIAFVVVGVLYFIGDMSKRQEELVARVAKLDKHNKMLIASVDKYQTYVMDQAKRSHNIQYGLRHTIDNGSNPVVLKRLEEYVFGDDDAQMIEFDWRDPA